MDLLNIIRSNKILKFKNWRCLFFVLALFFISVTASAQELKIKATFTLNIIKYIGWTDAQKEGDFIIGVVGKEALSAAIREQAEGRKFGFQNIVVRDFSKANKISPCQVLYVGENAMYDLLSDKIIQNCGGKGFLLITEDLRALEKGSVVNFYMDGNSVKFEISQFNATKLDITYNSKLETLASSVQR